MRSSSETTKTNAKATIGWTTLALLVSVVTAGCAADADADGDEDEEVEATSAAVSAPCTSTRAQILASVTGGRRTAISRGFEWLDERVAYSQSRSYESYRTDCSGFVSMCWELGRSYTTADFVAGGGQSELLGSYDSLRPADALVRRSNGAGHIVLFLGWNDAAHSSACVLEQASTASDMQFRTRTTSSLRASNYRAIRADKF